MSEHEKIMKAIESELGEWNTHDWGGTPWVSFWGKGLVNLDGDFTRRELEIMARHMDYEPEKDSRDGEYLQDDMGYES